MDIHNKVTFVLNKNILILTLSREHIRALNGYENVIYSVYFGFSTVLSF